MGIYLVNLPKHTSKYSFGSALCLMCGSKYVRIDVQRNNSCPTMTYVHQKVVQKQQSLMLF